MRGKRREPDWHRPERWLVTAPGDREYLVTVEPALAGWVWRPGKQHAWLLGDTSWWVDVEVADAPWRVLRERYDDMGSARARGVDLARELEEGTLRLGVAGRIRRRVR